MQARDNRAVISLASGGGAAEECQRDATASPGTEPQSERTPKPRVKAKTGTLSDDGTVYSGYLPGAFLVNLKIPIVSTSVVSIADGLQGFSQSSRVVTAYLLTYTSFVVNVAELSDVTASVMQFRFLGGATA